MYHRLQFTAIWLILGVKNQAFVPCILYKNPTGNHFYNSLPTKCVKTSGLTILLKSGRRSWLEAKIFRVYRDVYDIAFYFKRIAKYRLKNPTENLNSIKLRRISYLWPRPYSFVLILNGMTMLINKVCNCNTFFLLTCYILHDISIFCAALRYDAQDPEI